MEQVTQFPAAQSVRDAARNEMAGIISRFAPVDGEHKTVIPSLSLYRYTAVTGMECGISRAALIFAAQGTKRVVVAGQAYHYGHMRGLITSVDLPMLSQVTEASPAAPYLCLALSLDPQRVADLMTQMRLPAPEAMPIGRAISLSTFSEPLLDALLRLLRLLDTPGDVPILAPMVEREVLYRLLTSEQGMRLRQIAAADSQTNKIGKAIAWIKQHYAEPLRIEHLAQAASMSVSSLHHHFKDVTALSPLQYQKQLRLHEARRLLLGRVHDVGSVAHLVGYESHSQFSREYSRLFGAPPRRDAEQLRELERMALYDGQA